MSSIEKIRAYIRRTGIKYDFSTPYQMSLSETLELARMSKEDASGAICLAFEYGRAKGERRARAALKKLHCQHDRHPHGHTSGVGFSEIF